MPGSVSNAAPTTVLPQVLCVSFAHSRQYPTLVNEYMQGESQRASLADSSRKSWQLTRRLTSALLTELQTFYLARKGPTQPFYFYDFFDSAGAYDATGAATTGRYTVHFVGGFTQTLALPRAEAGFGLVELA